MGLSRCSCGHISGPHEPIPTKFWLWMFFIMLHRDMVSKTLKCKKKKFFVTSSLLYSIYRALHIHVQKHRKCEPHACLIGRVPRHSSPAGMQNPKFGRSCVHCVIQNSQLLRSHFCRRVKRFAIQKCVIFLNNNNNNNQFLETHNTIKK